MKKLIFVFALTSTLISCKKETSSPTTSNGNNSIDTTKNVDTTTQTVTTPLINSLDCSGAVITGSLKMGDASNTVTVKINYSGGNGKAYPAQSIYSTIVTGLTAKLTSGTLVNGNGSLLFEISGNPASVGTANFEIKFGGKTCSIHLNIEEVKPTSGYGPNIDDVDGNSYKTVYIGTQQWMSENLKVSMYNDGTAIPKVTDNTKWSLLTTGAWTYYNKDEANKAKYGNLYNWYVVSPTTNGNKNVCPTGWHVPTDAEWKILIDYLGGTFVAGGKMKEDGTTSWVSPNTDATNTSLFTALPGAYRVWKGDYYNIGYAGGWWSSTEVDTSSVLIRMLDSHSGAAGKQSMNKKGGLAVRCLRD